MIKASIIVPTYKRPQVTAKCLSLLSQSQFLNEKFSFEVVVIDSSPDKSTWDAIKEYQKSLDINYLHLDRQTMPSEARNLGIAKAKYELIISLDSDIEVKKTTVWQMITYLKDHPGVARMTGTSIFSSGSKKGTIDRPTKWDRTFSQGQTIYIEGIYGRYEAFYKSPFLKIHGYDKIFEFCGEGTDISVRYWRAGFPLGIETKIMADHNSEAPESLRRSIPDRMTHMYRSLFLVAFKYDVEKPKLSPNFIKSYEERRAAYGNLVEFYAVVSSAKSISWFHENYQQVLDSKRKAPKVYDFKPFDVFSDKKQLKHCLAEASKRIASSYQKVFGE